ncbi:MAG: hypothetical protein HOP09_06705 [Hyphomicrobium sp.]|nr:hypothetical protein [Hyphomicrobium sp.]
MAEGNGHDKPNVTSLDDARRRAAEKAKAEKRGTAPVRGPRTARDWLIGGVTIAFAVGFVAWMLMRLANAVSGGAA